MGLVATRWNKVATNSFGVVATIIIFDIKCSYMAKTKPIGVRFDENVLERFRNMEINSPQKALNFMEGLFMRTTDDIGKIVAERNQPSKLTVRDISPTGEVKQTYNLETKEPINIKPEIDVKAIEQRIKDLEYELKHPPKSPQIGMRKWVGFREDEIKQLQTKLNQ